jgi:hypothetical protein
VAPETPSTAGLARAAGAAERAGWPGTDLRATRWQVPQPAQRARQEAQRARREAQRARQEAQRARQEAQRARREGLSAVVAARGVARRVLALVGKAAAPPGLEAGRPA